MLLQLEMYQPQYQNPQQQQQNTVVVPSAQNQSVVFVPVSPPVVYEFYQSRQAMIAGIVLIVAGSLAIVFNIVGLILFEFFSWTGDGMWCGAMVSLALLAFFA